MFARVPQHTSTGGSRHQLPQCSNRHILPGQCACTPDGQTRCPRRVAWPLEGRSGLVESQRRRRKARTQSQARLCSSAAECRNLRGSAESACVLLRLRIHLLLSPPPPPPRPASHLSPPSHPVRAPFVTPFSSHSHPLLIPFSLPCFPLVSLLSPPFHLLLAPFLTPFSSPSHPLVSLFSPPAHLLLTPFPTPSYSFLLLLTPFSPLFSHSCAHLLTPFSVPSLSPLSSRSSTSLCPSMPPPISPFLHRLAALLGYCCACRPVHPQKLLLHMLVSSPPGVALAVMSSSMLDAQRTQPQPQVSQWTAAASVPG